MANSSQTSRRNFLSTLAILSAGAAIGTPRTILSTPVQATALHHQWKKFYTSNGGIMYHQPIDPALKAQINVCSGHVYKTGQPVCFSADNLVAEPTWIYWGADKKDPADVIITFYQNDDEKKKIFRINRFELDGLNALSSRLPDQRIVMLLNQDAQKANHSDDQVKKLRIKTRIKKDQRLYLTVIHEEMQLDLERYTIYHS